MINKLTGTFLMLLTVFVISAYGQTGRVQGVITDRITGETLAGASVVLEGTTIG